MKRRPFLAAALAAGGLLVWAFSRSTQEETIAAMVYTRLSYLKLDPTGVQHFARDFAARGLLSSARLRTVGLVWPLYRRLPLEGFRFADRVDHAAERIVSTYLISSDFFTNGADQSKTVFYRGCYDALSHACGNPFCRAVEA
jgi:hypothetical protein